MSTECAMDTADDSNNSPPTARRRTTEDSSNLPDYAEYRRSIRILLNSPEPSSSVSDICSRISDLSEDLMLSSYEQYEAGMPTECTFRSADELPAFRIQSLSPTSRSLSPIEFNDDNDDDDDDENGLLTFSLSPCGSSSGDLDESSVIISCSSRFQPEFDKSSDADVDDGISIASINALIGTPPASSAANGKRLLNLETIFEGVFLHTPPPQKSARIKQYVEDQHQQHQSRHRRLELPDLLDDEYCDDSPAQEHADTSESLLLLSIRN